ncbi:cell division protein FtsH [Candidatus Shapirobacteria bacterium CG08_land_8_20_14_0_20_39_18]|uniref:ATP-dependent zinc metalloprotease FtsH n=1 Tax=Candidatus Shapirobacteria bacterium CG08_land_8_20_14_0_20_39_18 TaxID=1974883 RepID=A0A2M6XCX1_9BACT|nr:MAG: cell division protein FtsH [Candidatus Shapirobacteria bacterium CG08_land_8_20_14_0_20_39_18]
MPVAVNNNNHNNVHKPLRKFEFKLKFNLQNIVIWLLVGFMALSFLFSLVGEVPKETKTVSLSGMITDIKDSKISKIEVVGNKLNLTYKDGKIATAQKQPDQALTQTLKEAGVDPSLVTIDIKDQSVSDAWLGILGTVLPLVLMAVFFLFIIRQARGAQDSIFSFGQSKARIFAKGKQFITFKDVAGVDEAKKELEEVVDFLKHPQKYRALGARTPKGVLLVGPSGCGKTLLAKAVAGEAGVPFFSMAGSEFMEMLVGVGAARVRDLFGNAKKSAPSIIFIDEIDAIGRMRGNGLAGGHDEREQTLNQILVEMDGFTPNDNVIVISATNRGDLLDSALLRPGRFDRRVIVDMPDLEARKAILKIHARGKPFADDVNWDIVAKRTVGFSGADIENMLNEAAIQAAREDRKQILMSDINEASLKVKLGPAKNKIQTDEDKKLTAYHEAGHAIVTYTLPDMDPVSRISIVARGVSLGHTLIPPSQDRTHETKSRLLAQIAAMMGGRGAEELVFKEMTTGAANDIEMATRIARSMVVDFGMSSLGPINLGPQVEYSDMGRAIWAEPSQISAEMASKVDNEVKRIMGEAYEKAQLVLKKSLKKLDLVAKTLIEKETLEQEEFEALMKK